MATKGQITLPPTSPRRRYSPPKFIGPSLRDLGKLLPRRYDETKTVNVQSLSHRSILDIGKLIEDKERDRQQRYVKDTILSTQQSTWERAETIKRRELQEAIERAALEREHALAAAKESEKRAIIRETSRVREELEELMQTKLEDQRIEAEKKLNDEIKATLHREEQLRRQAFREGRIYERSIAEKESEEMSREFNRRRHFDHKKYEQAKLEALQLLEKNMQEEREKALKNLREELANDLLSQINAIKREHDEEVVKLERAIGAYQLRCSELRQQLRHQCTLKIMSDKKLEEVIKEFQQFIDLQPTFQKGQAEYLIKIL